MQIYKVGGLDTSEVPEGSNLYYTNSRSRSSISVSSPLSYSSSNGIISIPASTNSVDGYLSSSDHTIFNNKEPAIASGTSLQYYRGDKTFQTLNTLAVPELTNLYYTDTRARNSISATSPITYSSGVIGAQVASSTLNGVLTSIDWNTFNNKQPSGNYVTTSRTISTNSPISGGGDLSSNLTISIPIATSSQNGYLGSSDWITFNNKLTSVGYTASTPSRSLNSNFTPSASKGVMVSYTIEITATATLSGGQTGQVELRSDTNSTPTTIRCSVTNTNSVSLAIAITIVNTQRAVLSYLVPPGHNVRLVSSGTATISIVNQSEVSLDII